MKRSGTSALASLICASVVALSGLSAAGCGGDDSSSGPIGTSGVVTPSGDAAASEAAPSEASVSEASASCTPNGSIVTFTRVYASVIMGYGCVGCHDGTVAQLDLKSSAAAAYAQLVGVATSDMSACAGRGLRVKPCDPDNSILYLKVKAKHDGVAATCGDGMPRVGMALSDADLASVQTWIAEGAQNN